MRTIKINEKEYEIKELKFVELADIQGTNNKERVIELIKKSVTNITEEQINNLNIREGNTIIKAINELNGLTEDFQ